VLSEEGEPPLEEADGGRCLLVVEDLGVGEREWSWNAPGLVDS
jgi:hypothetical protein